MSTALAAYRATLTQGQKDALLEQARAARIAKKQEREANKHNLKLSYLDSNYWATLASKFKIRMPSNEEAVTTSTIRKYLNKLSIPVDVWNEHYTSIKYFVENNPKWTKYAAAGLCLEIKEQA
jgi:hypothetical protein